MVKNKYLLSGQHWNKSNEKIRQQSLTIHTDGSIMDRSTGQEYMGRQIDQDFVLNLTEEKSLNICQKSKYTEYTY